MRAPCHSQQFRLPPRTSVGLLEGKTRPSCKGMAEDAEGAGSKAIVPLARRNASHQHSEANANRMWSPVTKLCCTPARMKLFENCIAIVWNWRNIFPDHLSTRRG